MPASRRAITAPSVGRVLAGSVMFSHDVEYRPARHYYAISPINAARRLVLGHGLAMSLRGTATKCIFDFGHMFITDQASHISL